MFGTLLWRELGFVIEYFWYVNTCVEYYFIHSTIFIFMVMASRICMIYVPYPDMYMGNGHIMFIYTQTTFCSGTKYFTTPISCDTCPRPLAWLRRASESQLNSTNFLQNSPSPPRASGAWRHSHLLAPFPIWAIVTSLSDTSSPPALVNVASK